MRLPPLPARGLVLGCVSLAWALGCCYAATLLNALAFPEEAPGGLLSGVGSLPFFLLVLPYAAAGALLAWILALVLLRGTELRRSIPRVLTASGIAVVLLALVLDPLSALVAGVLAGGISMLQCRRRFPAQA